MPNLRLDLIDHAGGRTLLEPVHDLVIAGWTARDAGLLEAHIQELAALGVPRPSATPLFYRVAANLLTQEREVQALGSATTGEAEVVIVSSTDGLCVGIGSDHTDRKLERTSVALSKQCCPKPIGPEVWLLDEIAAHWDRLVLRSWLTKCDRRQLYQDGVLGGLQPPAALIARYAGPAGLPPATALFCGTLPVHGALRGGERFEFELLDPVLDRVLRHSYEIREIPVVA